MFKKYKCTETGNIYKIWAMPNGLFNIKEQWGDYDEYVFDCMPTTLEEIKSV